MIILLAWLASSLVTYQNLNIKILYTQYGFVRDELRKTSPQPQQNQSNPIQVSGVEAHLVSGRPAVNE